MDPDEALARIRQLVVDAGDDGLDSVQVANDLADAVHDLDEWLSKGGFPPAAWAENVDFDVDRSHDHA